MRALATGPRVALAADARRDAHHRVAREVAAAAAPRRHVVGARRDAHARSPGPRARWPPPRGFATGPPGVASAPPAVVRASASDAPDRGPGFGFGSRALDASRLDARGRVPVGARTVILGIETSCDDTGAAVVTGDGRVLGEALASQGEIHARWGGVVPNLAREAHESAIDDVVARALAAANVSPENLSAVAVTVGPGLSMCLRVGVVKAQDLCHEHGLPIVPVHHMEAHALVARVGDGATANESNADAAAADADADDADDVDDALVRAPFPFLALLVSGGHNQLILARAVGEYRVLGGALDDALGEAYDKTARLLGLDVGGGGGPALEALARRGDPKAYRFPVPLRRRKDCDFSYAGLKTAVRLAIERDLGKPADGDAFARARGLSDGNDASAGDAEDPSFSAEETARRDAVRADIAASFQAAAVKHLEERTRRAIAWARESLANDTKAEPSGGNLSCVVVAGGVAANATVRATLGAVASEAGLPLVLPPPRWCTDNGVMVAWAGVERFALGLAEEAPSAEQVSTPTEEEPGRKTRREVPLLPRWPLGTKDARATGEVKSSKTARIAPPLRGAPG